MFFKHNGVFGDEAPTAAPTVNQQLVARAAQMNLLGQQSGGWWGALSTGEKAVVVGGGVAVVGALAWFVMKRKKG